MMNPDNIFPLLVYQTAKHAVLYKSLYRMKFLAQGFTDPDAAWKNCEDCFVERCRQTFLHSQFRPFYVSCFFGAFCSAGVWLPLLVSLISQRFMPGIETGRLNLQNINQRKIKLTARGRKIGAEQGGKNNHGRNRNLQTRIMRMWKSPKREYA